MSSPLTLTSGYTIGVIACGTMGTAVLSAIINTLSAPQIDGADESKAPLPAKFLATVNSQSSVERLAKTFGDKVQISIGKNDQVVEKSDLIILGCKPFLAETILTPIPKELFKGKTVVSLLAGKTIAQLTELTGAHVARAMTNTPAKVSKQI